MTRESKIHLATGARDLMGVWRSLAPCGVDGRTTHDLKEVTCRICMFHILAGAAPWAREFLDNLRGKKTSP